MNWWSILVLRPHHKRAARCRDILTSTNCFTFSFTWLEHHHLYFLESLYFLFSFYWVKRQTTVLNVKCVYIYFEEGYKTGWSKRFEYSFDRTATGSCNSQSDVSSAQRPACSIWNVYLPTKAHCTYNYAHTNILYYHSYSRLTASFPVHPG